MVADVQEGRQREGFGRRFPTFYALTAPLRRLFGNRRGVARLAALLLAAVAIPAAWWAVQLVGLPDVGAPFDVEAFRAETVPDGRNAFVLYRQAAARYRPLTSKDMMASLPTDLHTRWSSVLPDARAWVEANREALALFREGSERPEALDPSQLAPTGGHAELQALRPFLRLTLLEASRLESQGDMDGARGWYRTALRAVHHLASRARAHRREEALRWRQHLNVRWSGWAADPRTTPAQLRRAVDDVAACAAIEPSETYTIKSEYLSINMFFEMGGGPYRGPPPRWLGTIHSLSTFGTNAPLLTTDHLQSLTAAWRAWRREPERSLRVFRLVTANRLAFYALPPDRRPKPEPSVPLCDLYPLGPGAPPAARALAPKALGRWLDASQDAPLLIPMSVGNRLRARELASRQALLNALTSELARRDPASVPPPAPVP